MKKASKILSLLTVAAFVMGCNVRGKDPLVISLDLSNAIALFNGNCTTKDKETDFTLYKISESGVTERVHVKTKKSDDDKFFIENTIFTNFLEVSDEYFFFNVRYSTNYFVSKKTGETFKVDGDYSFHHYSYWFDSTNPIRDFSKDSNGNLYGRVYDYKAKTDVLAKFTITDKKVKVENIGEVPKDSSDKNYFNGYAVDKDGNIAYFGNGAWKYVTQDKNIIPLSDIRAVWTGYDNEIYSHNKNGNIEKLSYDKDNNKVMSTVVREYPKLNDIDLINAKMLYIDKTQQIYVYSGKSDGDLTLYQIYGDNPVEKVYTPEDLSNNDSNRYYQYEYSHSSVACDEDCIYVTGYDGTSFTVNKIDTSKDMELTKIKYNVDYNDGTRFLNNKKMLIFWWGRDQIYDDKEDSLASMSVSILDLNTGKMSEQDKFLTGNSDRSSVINLKSYK